MCTAQCGGGFILLILGLALVVILPVISSVIGATISVGLNSAASFPNINQVNDSWFSEPWSKFVGPPTLLASDIPSDVAIQYWDFYFNHVTNAADVATQSATGTVVPNIVEVGPYRYQEVCNKLHPTKDSEIGPQLNADGTYTYIDMCKRVFIPTASTWASSVGGTGVTTAETDTIVSLNNVYAAIMEKTGTTNDNSLGVNIIGLAALQTFTSAFCLQSTDCVAYSAAVAAGTATTQVQQAAYSSAMTNGILYFAGASSYTPTGNVQPLTSSQSMMDCNTVGATFKCSNLNVGKITSNAIPQIPYKIEFAQFCNSPALPNFLKTLTGVYSSTYNAPDGQISAKLAVGILSPASTATFTFNGVTYKMGLTVANGSAYGSAILATIFNGALAIFRGTIAAGGSVVTASATFQATMQALADSYSAAGSNVVTTATGMIGGTSLTIPAGVTVAVGQSVSGTGIAASTTVTAVSGTTVTLDRATTAALSSSSVTFGCKGADCMTANQLVYLVGYLAMNSPVLIDTIAALNGASKYSVGTNHFFATRTVDKWIYNSPVDYVALALGSVSRSDYFSYDCDDTSTAAAITACKAALRTANQFKTYQSGMTNHSTSDTYVAWRGLTSLPQNTAANTANGVRGYWCNKIESVAAKSTPNVCPSTVYRTYSGHQALNMSQDLNSTITMFVPQVYRKINLVYSTDSVVSSPTNYWKDIDTKQFVISDASLAPQAEYQMVYTGMIDLKCPTGASTIATMPRFYQVPSDALNNYALPSGLSGPTESHKVIIDIDPITGFALNGRLRLQLNTVLPVSLGVNQAKKPMLFPALWIDKNKRLSEDSGKTISRIPIAITAARIMWYVGFVIGAIFFVAGLLMVMAHFCCGEPEPAATSGKGEIDLPTAASPSSASSVNAATNAGL